MTENPKTKEDASSKLSRFSRPDKNTSLSVLTKNTKGASLNGKQLLSNLSFSPLALPTKTKKDDENAKSTPPKRRGLRSAQPKLATSLTIRDVKKKFGARRPYSIAALLSLRLKCKSFLEVDEIEGVLQEGIGDETGLKGLHIFQQKERKKESSKTSRKLNPKQLNAVKKSITPPQEKKSAKTETKEPTKAPVKTKTKKKAEKQKEPVYNIEELTNVEPLRKSANRWKVGRKLSPEQMLMGKVKGILNKITFERFDTLSASLIQFIKAKIKTADQLKLVVSELFTKTVQEKHFGPLYADLCCQLQDLSFADPLFDTEVTFKVALVNQCQHEFENVFKPVELSGGLSVEERDMKILQAKQRALGTVQFIGQLYMKDLLPDTICRVCLINLVSSNPTDLQVESAYQLLLTIGQKYDSKDRGKHHLDSIFGVLTNTSNSESSLKQRTKILVSIIKDVRKNNWVPPVKIEKAKTLEEIHQEFEAEKGKIQISGRGQATFDEYILDATSKYSKQLKFALSGGCAIRRKQGEDAANANVAPDLSMMDQLILQSSAIVDASMIVDMTKKQEEEELEGQSALPSVQLMPPEDRAAIEKSFIRTFLINRTSEDYTGPEAMNEFITTIKRMGWPEKGKLIDEFLNFMYDMSADDGFPLGQALAQLLKEEYVSADEFVATLNDFCEFFTMVEGDAPKAVSYFADMMSPVLETKIITLEHINEALQKDSQMDVWDLENENKKAAKPFGRRPEFLGIVTRACKDLEFNVTDWGLEEAQTADWRKRYPQ